MSEWKDFDIYDIPSDILNGKYEGRRPFGFDEDGNKNYINFDSMYDFMKMKFNKDGLIYKFQYRKIEPKRPTHEEIMTKWWLRSNCIGNMAWWKVSCYNYSFGYLRMDVNGKGYWHTKEEFKSFESSTLPPETE